MKHTVVYLGYYPLAFEKQRAGVFKMIRKDGTVDPANEPANVTGVFFGCMEDADPGGGKRFLAVRAWYDDIDAPLETAVLFNPDRHTDGKGFGPNPPTFGDESAERLLADMVESNPGSEAQLREIANRVGLTLSM